jgi:hypothetical protein
MRCTKENIVGISARAAVGTLAVCGVLVLAGCSSGTTASTTASMPSEAASVEAESTPSTPAAAESPAADELTNPFDTMAQPDGLSDDLWVKVRENYVITTDFALEDLTPEELSGICTMDMGMLEAEFGDAQSYGSDSADTVGFGTAAEWSALWTKWLENTRQIACELSK